MTRLTLALFILFVLCASSLPSLSLASPMYHPRYFTFNVTSGNLGVDPSYYSFEAFGYLPPNETPVVVKVVQNLVFNDTAWKPYYIHVTIPKGNYSFVLMNVSVREVNGTQFDRPLYIFVNGVPVFWGSTQEILNSTASVDLTPFENLLQGNVTFEPVLVNFYDAKVNITGLYLLNVTLFMYPGQKPYGLPNGFVPLFVNGTFHYNYSYVILNPSKSSYTSQVSLPNGTFRVSALLYEEGGGLDEFWYSNEPATRDILLSYDGLIAGVVPPYETVYTGGIDLFWWKPMPSINTLAFHTPYQVDLTPFLALGDKANITVSVTNLQTAEQVNHSPAFSWEISGVLLLWINESNPLLGGHLTVAYSRFLDSSPIFNGGFSGLHYQESGNYLLRYSSTLMFTHGAETVYVVQQGKFYASQSFNPIYQFAYLDEQFSEVATETGMYNSSLKITGNYPVTLQISAFATPITPTNFIPFNLSYAQNGSIELGATYSYTFSINGHTTQQYLNEKVNATGGFSGVIEVINTYGGAVLVKLLSNNAITSKTLQAQYLIDGVGYREVFLAVAKQNRTVNSTGYYLKIERAFSPIDFKVDHQEAYPQSTQEVSLPSPRLYYLWPFWTRSFSYSSLRFEYILLLSR